MSYRRLLHSAALPITDRRWAAPLSAIALGFGLFVGVAIGPGAAGTLATGATQIVELPSQGAVEKSAPGDGADSLGPVVASEGGGGKASPPEALPSSVPLESESSEPPPAEPATAPPDRGPPPAPEAEAPAAEAEEEEQSLTGVVVHSNPAAGSYALAIAGGGLVSIHTRTIPSPGAKLSMQVAQLANGTYAEDGKPKRDGRVARASFGGTVTFVDPDPVSPAYTVSGRGASVLVHVVPDPAGAAPALPALGSFATVDVRIAKPEPVTPEAAAPAPEAPPAACGPGVALPPPPAPVEPSVATLWQSRVQVDGVPATRVELAAIVTGICPDGHAILLSADDSHEIEDDLVLAVPPKIVTAKLDLGDSVLATAEIGEGAALVLTGLASDEQARGADDAKAAQGDLKR